MDPMGFFNTLYPSSHHGSVENEFIVKETGVFWAHPFPAPMGLVSMFHRLVDTLPETNIAPEN